MGKISIRYRWRYFDELRGQFFTTKHWAAAEEFLLSHPGATPIPASEQRLELPDDPLANTTARFNSGPPDGNARDSK